MSRRSTAVFAFALVAAFAFRLWYGLSLPFWTEDERQVYLIGLRSFARGEWPYFGADVVWTAGQVPGALLGLLIRWPLTLWPAPESPVILLNVLSFAALALFAWYLSRRLPQVPRWLIWSALLTLPWTMGVSTDVVNTSYVLTGAILFFTGFFEGAPAFRRGIIPLTVAWGLMGAGVLWVLQLHMSWVLLPPYGAYAAYGVTREGKLPRAIAGFAAGALITGSVLIPTLIQFGLGALSGQGAISWQSQSPLALVTTAARVLSFASFEMNRFLGPSSVDRAMVLTRHPWLVPAALVVIVAGIVQPLAMVVAAFRRAPAGAVADWTRVRQLTLATIVLIYVSYFFSVRWPQAHAFYVMFPVAALFAATCWQVRAQANGGRLPRLERVAIVVLVAGTVLHAGLAIDRRPRQSLYVDRALVASAIALRNDRYLGDRRDTRWTRDDHALRPVDHISDPIAFHTARAENDLQVVRAEWMPALGRRISTFSLTVTNRSRAAAWLDIRYATAYLGAGGQLLTARDGVIKQILQPGETREWRDVTDGWVPEGAVSATIAVTSAEKVVPSPVVTRRDPS